MDIKRLLFISLILLLVLSLLPGCASSTRQADNLLSSHRKEFKSVVRIEGVPFVNQDVGQCGPATLTMAMNWAGKNISVDEVSKQAYTPGMKGTLQTDMISTTRRQGLIALPIEGLASLLREVEAGNPVIVFENLGLSWLPQWHYAIVHGYDLRREVVYMHSGPEQNKMWDLRKFERSWKLADYWGLLVLPPHKLSKTSSELAHASAAASLEQLGMLEEAATAYKTILTRWPKSLSALIGIANYEYLKKNYQKSVEYLRLAVEAHPNSVPAKYNLSIAESAASP